MNRLKYLPPDPPAGGSFPASGFFRFESNDPYVLIWAVRFNLTTGAGSPGGARLPGILFGNQSADEAQRLWACTGQITIDSLAFTVVCGVGLPMSSNAPANGVAMYVPIPKVPLESGAVLVLQGPADPTDSIANIQIFATSGELQELMQS